MESGLFLLCLNAAAIAGLHALIGPDHYVPFIAMARARRWSAWRTGWITVACGLGHVGSSLLLGLVGVACGWELQRIARIESFRGHVATWALMAFGAVYFAWGLRRALRGHAHEPGTPLGSEHGHGDEPVAPATAWILFIIFVLGPCEPMIPLIMFPAAGQNWPGVALVTMVFGAITIATMLAMVLLGRQGVQFVPMKKLERYGHALAGATILVTGGAIRILES